MVATTVVIVGVRAAVTDLSEWVCGSVGLSGVAVIHSLMVVSIDSVLYAITDVPGDVEVRCMVTCVSCLCGCYA